MMHGWSNGWQIHALSFKHPNTGKISNSLSNSGSIRARLVELLVELVHARLNDWSNGIRLDK
jgi:hypothetical protein